MDHCNSLDSLTDDYDTYHREKEFIQEVTARHNVFMFSKSRCPFCKRLENLFAENNIAYTAMELDNHSNGPNIQDALEELTGGTRPVPAVYICNKFRGGYNEIHSAWADGTLQEWVKCIDTDFPYHLVVIGGGTGGLAVAKEAANLGKSVAICDYVPPSPNGAVWGLGGTDCNVGCIPNKLMHRASLIYHDIRDAEFYGWEVEIPEFHNWELMVEKIQEHIRALNWDNKKQLRELGIAYFNGKATLIDNHTIEVIDASDNKSELKTRTIVIATGGRPMYIDAIGAEEFCITSDYLFSLKTHPGKVVIVGGGFVALETAAFLNIFGCDVKVLVRSTPLRQMDQDMVERLTKHMEARGIEFLYGATALKFGQQGKKQIFVEGITCDDKCFQEICDTVILAVGRCPNTTDFGLENVGVKLDYYTGKILVNKREQTSISNIFAIGDCRHGCPELSSIASKAGTLLAYRLYRSSETYLDYHFIPQVVFTTMEYAFVGETEEHALTIHGDTVEVYHNLFQPYESALSNGHRALDTCCAGWRKLHFNGDSPTFPHILRNSHGT